jgi:hypothetical protein
VSIQIDEVVPDEPIDVENTRTVVQRRGLSSPLDTKTQEQLYRNYVIVNYLFGGFKNVPVEAAFPG